MKWVPRSVIFLQRTLPSRNTAQILARQLPSEYQDDGNSGDDPKELLLPPSPTLSHSLTGRIPADLRSQTSQIVGAPRDFPLDSAAHPSDTPSRGWHPSPDCQAVHLTVLRRRRFNQTWICHVVTSASIAPRSVNADSLPPRPVTRSPTRCTSAPNNP